LGVLLITFESILTRKIITMKKSTKGQERGRRSFALMLCSIATHLEDTASVFPGHSAGHERASVFFGTKDDACHMPPPHIHLLLEGSMTSSRANISKPQHSVSTTPMLIFKCKRMEMMERYHFRDSFSQSYKGGDAVI
jgi:hypothetical protein